MYPVDNISQLHCSLIKTTNGLQIFDEFLCVLRTKLKRRDKQKHAQCIGGREGRREGGREGGREEEGER